MTRLDRAAHALAEAEDRAMRREVRAWGHERCSYCNGVDATRWKRERAREHASSCPLRKYREAKAAKKGRR